MMEKPDVLLSQGDFFRPVKVLVTLNESIKLRSASNPSKILGDLEKKSSSFFWRNIVGLDEKNVIRSVVSEREKDFPSSERYSDRFRRALQYIYFPESLKENDLSKNPLVDVLTLITLGLSEEGEHFRDFNDYEKISDAAFSLVVPGEPRQAHFFDRRDKRQASKTNQFSYKDSKPDQSFRVISQFEGWQKTMIRALNILSRGAENSSSFFLNAIQEYANSYNTDDKEMGLGLLDVIYNAGLFEDSRFFPLVNICRRVFLDEEKVDYGVLKNKYPYRVVLEKPDFWKETERFMPPGLTSWREALKKREVLKRQIADETPKTALTREALRSSNPQDLLHEVLRSRRKRSVLTAEKNHLEKGSRQFLEFSWRRALKESFNNGHKHNPDLLKENNVKSAVSLIESVINYFLKDETVSAKLKSQAAHEAYKIDVHRIFSNPNFSWLLNFDNPVFAKDFEKMAASHPVEAQSLFKLIFYEAAKTFFSSKEVEFLFDPDFERKIDIKQMSALISSLTSSARVALFQAKDFRDEFMKAAQNPTDLSDLFQGEKAKARQKTLAELNYEKVIWRFKRRKNIKWTKESTKKLSTRAIISGTALILLGSCLFGTILGVGKLWNLIDPPDSSYASGYELREGVFSSMPDLKKPDTPEKGPRNFFKFADVLHLPDGLQVDDKSEFGFFPTVYYVDDIPFPLSAFIDDRKTVDVQLQNQIDNSHIPFSWPQNQLVYRSSSYPGKYLYPPQGLQIKKIFELSKFFPQAETGLVVGLSSRPSEAVIAAEGQIIPLTDSYRVIQLKENGQEYKSEYYFGASSYAKGLIFSSELKGDQRLHDLYMNFIYELKGVTDMGTKDYYSDIILKYAKLYAVYTQENRHYSLTYESNSLPKSSGIIDLASHPNAGYECTTSAQAFQGFMQSVGVRVLKQAGSVLVYHNGAFYANPSGHVNNLLFLPDGRIFNIDMTPVDPRETPAVGSFENLIQVDSNDVFEGDVINSNGQDNLAETILKIGLGSLLSLGVIYAAISILRRRQWGEAQAVVEDSFESHAELSDFEKRITAGFLSYLLSLQGTHRPEKISEALEILKKFTEEGDEEKLLQLINDETFGFQENNVNVQLANLIFLGETSSNARDLAELVTTSLQKPKLFEKMREQLETRKRLIMDALGEKSKLNPNDKYSSYLSLMNDLLTFEALK